MIYGYAGNDICYPAILVIGDIIKALYPDMNLLFLDYDAGMSEVNLQNRLHFMVENARAAVPSQRL